MTMTTHPQGWHPHRHVDQIVVHHPDAPCLQVFEIAAHMVTPGHLQIRAPAHMHTHAHTHNHLVAPCNQGHLVVNIIHPEMMFPPQPVPRLQEASTYLTSLKAGLQGTLMHTHHTHCAFWWLLHPLLRYKCAPSRQLLQVMKEMRIYCGQRRQRRQRQESNMICNRVQGHL